MKKIILNTNFSKENPPENINKKKDDPWKDSEQIKETGSYPNNYFIDFNHMPEKLSYIFISGKNLITSDDEFLEKYRIFKTFQDNKLDRYTINIFDDYYFKLREKKEHFADIYLLYDDFHFQDGNNPDLISIDIMLDSFNFNNIYNKISNIEDKFNFDITLSIDENNIFPENKKKGIESARYDIIDFVMK